MTNKKKPSRLKTARISKKKMATAAEDADQAGKLPKGLAEFKGSLSDPKFSMELLSRLLDLPGNSFGSEIERHKEALVAVRAADNFFRNARHHAALMADNLFVAAMHSYTTKELQEATGYTDDD